MSTYYVLLTAYCLLHLSYEQEAGLDSLMAVKGRHILQQTLGPKAAPLPVSMLFEYPTVRRLYSDAISPAMESPLSAAAAHTPAAASVAGLSAALADHPALTGGSSCSFMVSGHDSICTVPFERWDLVERWDVTAESAGAISKEQRFGGFMNGAELFDNGAFSISPAEAGAIDPQQRLLLEHSYQAFHSSGLDRGSLMASLCGVFVGIENMDFGWMSMMDRCSCGVDAGV